LTIWPGPLLHASAKASIAETMDCRGTLYAGLWRPILLAALNTEPEAASAGSPGRAAGDAGPGRAGLPASVRGRGPLHAFVDPAVRRLAAGGAPVGFGRPAEPAGFDGKRVVALDFAGERSSSARRTR